MISQRDAPGTAKSLLGNAPARRNERSSARVVAQHQRRHCRDTQSASRGNALHDRVRLPRRKQRGHESFAAKTQRGSRRGEDPVGQIRLRGIVTTRKQQAAAKRNIKKAAKAAQRKKTIARLPRKTRTALGKEGAKAARKKRVKGK
jgi:hypothetical protein